jgi:hypothetical protein
LVFKEGQEKEKSGYPGHCRHPEPAYGGQQEPVAVADPGAFSAGEKIDKEAGNEDRCDKPKEPGLGSGCKMEGEIKEAYCGEKTKQEAENIGCPFTILFENDHILVAHE